MLRIVLLLLLCSGSGCVQWYSGSAKGDIQRNFLHTHVPLGRRCVIIEWAASGDATYESLYDETGQPTRYAVADQWWLIRLFTKPDYRIGDYEFLDVSRYHQRVYALSDKTEGPFSRQWPQDSRHPDKKLTFGPLKVYPLESGTSVYVARFHSMWISDSMSTMEFVDVVLRVTLPGTDKEVDVVCPIEYFDRIIRAQP